MEPNTTDPPNVRFVTSPLEPTSRAALVTKSLTVTCFELLISPSSEATNASYSLRIDAWHCFRKMFLSPPRILFRNRCMPTI